MKALNTISKLISRRSVQLSAFAAVAFVAQAACSSEPPASNPGNNFPTAGSSSGGTPGASGSGFGTSGTPTAGAATAGTSFGNAGTDTGGTGGAGTAGTGGAAAGTAGTPTAGTGGTGVVVPPLDCTNTGTALPITQVSTWGFPDSGDDSYTETMLGGTGAACEAAGLEATAPGCWSLKWTPVTRTYVHWYWHNTAANWSGQGVCVAAGAKAVILKAKGDSAFNAKFVAAGVEKTVAITTEWQDVVIDIAGTNYNSVNAAGGVNTGIVAVLDRLATETTARTLYFYDVQWVAEVPVGGGEGGAGGEGGGPG